MCDQEVQSCDCVDEETKCIGARVLREGADTAGEALGLWNATIDTLEFIHLSNLAPR